MNRAIAHVKDLSGRGALHLAAHKGKLNVCKYLLEELKLDVNERDMEGGTALCYASDHGHLSTVIYLIENGADPAVSNEDNATALHLATSEGNVEIIQVLISRGADVNAFSVNRTPLQIAILLSYLDAFKTLLDNGANPNLFATLFPSPLDYSISTSTRSLECTKSLLQMGLKPIELAAQNRYHREVEYIFPVTSPIPTCSDWSIPGIMKP